MRREARDTAASYGVLPAGTLLKITGEAEGNFYPVEVELEKGSLEGWVPANLLGLEEQDREQRAQTPAKVEGTTAPLVAKKNRRIPKDETLLLRREPSFFYGVGAGPLLSIINAIDGNSFSGIGISAGGHVGFFLGPELPLRIEVLYNGLSGADARGNGANFGFVDAGASIAYHLSPIEFFGKLSYSLGVSVSSLPGTLNNSFTSVSDLSALWIGAGVGYRFTVSDLLKITTRLSYNLSFLQSPFTFQTIGLLFFIDLQG